jgi:undecaprenyl diphosphate synthase
MGVRLDALPRHVAIIMDGNGRWAKHKGLPRLLGHREGYRTLKQTLTSANDLGIEYLTCYAFSSENWSRPQDEVGGLMTLIFEAAKKELAELAKSDVKVRISGRLKAIPDNVREGLLDLERSTRNHKGLTFVLAVNYGGRGEIVDAVKHLIQDGVPADEVDVDQIAQRLYCPEVPDPDLMIRTAGEFRWSNFLLWQSAYSELFVSDVPWPEFDQEQFLGSVLQYQKRIRKFGGL